MIIKMGKFLINNLRSYLLFRKINNKLSIAENDIAFVSTSRIGDNLFVMALANEIKKHHQAENIILVLPPKLRKISELFEEIDRIVYCDDSVLETICFSHFGGYIEGMKHPQKGKLNIAHPASVAKIFGLNGFTFLDTIKLQLGIPFCTKLTKPKEISDNDIDRVSKKLAREDIDPYRAIFISLESRSVRFDEKYKFMLIERILGYFVPRGYMLIFNEKKWYEFVVKKYPEKIDAVRYLYLDLFEAFVAGAICKKVIAVRSGWVDWMTFTGSKMIIFYPELYFPFLNNPKKYIDFFSISKMFKGINDNILDVELSGKENFDEIFKFITV